MSIAAQIAASIAQDQASCPQLPAQMTPALYANLRRLAHSLMRRERAGHTLQPTAVVNEAFLRLAHSQVHPNDAPHFFRLAARTMRRLLVDHARERGRMKRDTPTVEELQAMSGPCTFDDYESWRLLDVLDVDAALDKLAESAPRSAELLELRYFAGLDDTEISALYGISRRTVERECRFAKAFLAKYAKAADRAAES